MHEEVLLLLVVLQVLQGTLSLLVLMQVRRLLLLLLLLLMVVLVEKRRLEGVLIGLLLWLCSRLRTLRGWDGGRIRTCWAVPQCLPQLLPLGRRLKGLRLFRRDTRPALGA